MLISALLKRKGRWKLVENQLLVRDKNVERLLNQGDCVLAMRLAPSPIYSREYLIWQFMYGQPESLIVPLYLTVRLFIVMCEILSLAVEEQRT